MKVKGNAAVEYQGNQHTCVSVPYVCDKRHSVKYVCRAEKRGICPGYGCCSKTRGMVTTDIVEMVYRQKSFSKTATPHSWNYKPKNSVLPLLEID